MWRRKELIGGILFELIRVRAAVKVRHQVPMSVRVKVGVGIGVFET